MMLLKPSNFFHHFNPSKKQNYSDEEIRFALEVLARVKRGRLTDGERVKVFEKEKLV